MGALGGSEVWDLLTAAATSIRSWSSPSFRPLDMLESCVDRRFNNPRGRFFGRRHIVTSGFG